MHTTVTKTFQALFGVVCLFVLLAACGGQAGNDSAAYTEELADRAPEAAVVESRANAPVAKQAAVGTNGSAQVAAPNAVQTPQPQLIIYNGSLEMEVLNDSLARQQVLDLARRLNGQLAQENSFLRGNDAVSELTLRIPSQNFNAFMDQAAALAHVLINRRVTSRDATEEYIDVEARLKTRRQKEETYRRMLTRAKNVKEMLDIERALQKVVEEIESAEGRLRLLRSRAAYSTVTVELFEQGVTEYGQPEAPGFGTPTRSV